MSFERSMPILEGEVSSAVGSDGVPTLAPRQVSGKIGVVTVLYNSMEVLPDFHTSLASQTYRNFLVFCVDNNSKDGSADYCEKLGNLYTVIRNTTNAGVAKGNNQGIEHALAAGCDYVLLINNDVSFGSDLFDQLLAGMNQHKAEMVTPLIYYHEPSDRVWCAGGTFRSLYGKRGEHYGMDETDHGQFSIDKKVDYSPTCCVLIKISLFKAVGMMDERYFVYWDDADWMLRAKRHGAKLWYLGAARLWHKVSSLTDGTSSDFTIRYGRRNNAYYLFKHLHWVVASAFTAVYCSYFVASLLLPSSRRIALLSLRSWIEGISIYRKSRIGSQVRR